MITLCVQQDMVDFALGSIAQSIGVSRYTCQNGGHLPHMS